MKVIEETKEKLPNFTVSFEGDLALLQVSESKESQRNRKQRISLREQL